MKKSTKLLSVFLAIVMLFSSMTVLASAARAQYKTAENLQALDAYSPDGEVTRLSTEERLSIIMDFLDETLQAANINPGTLFNVVGLSLTLDLRSIDKICWSFDNVKSLRENGLVNMVSGSLGIIKDLDVSTWQTGMTRDNQKQINIVNELVEFINANRPVIKNVISTGNVDLGLANSALSGVDLSIIKDIPGLIKGIVFPLFYRVDDTTAWADEMYANSTGAGKVQATLEKVATGLLTKSQSYTTYMEDAEGNCISNHELPMSSGLRTYFVKGSDSTGAYMTAKVYDPATKAYADQVDENGVATKYYRTEEKAADGSGSGKYVYQDAEGNNLKYHTTDDYAVPSLKAAIESDESLFDLDTKTVAQLFYTAIPYVFKDLAPVVLEGSVKKLLAELFGAEFTYIGTVGSEAVQQLPEYDAENALFQKEHEKYTFGWSDYAVLNGVHYYRYEDDIYQGDLSSTNDYFNIINWDYTISDDFFNEFIPGADGNTPSAAGYTTMLQGLNDFIYKAASTLLSSEVNEGIAWEKGDNSKLLDNVKRAARYVVQYNPEAIFGEDYKNGYYDMMMDEGSTDQEVICAIAATLLDFLMPQLILPSAEQLKGQSIGALFAYVLRELATQFVPTYNYDDLVFDDYNTRTLRAGKDNSYWLDVCVTIGVDIGMSYLKELTDLGEDTEVGYKFAATKTYTRSEFDANPQKWEETIDWIIDWALSDDYEWTWKLEKLIDCGETVDLATPQDPWVKLGNILKLLPIDQLLNVDTSNSNWLETAVRDGLVLNILNLNVEPLIGGSSANGLFNIPVDSILRTTNTFSAAATVVRDLLNNLLYKVGGNQNLMNPAVFTSIDSVFNQSNLATLIDQLLLMVNNAVRTNGLLDPVLPLVNMFVGWKTTRQEMARPTITFSNDSGKNYVYTKETQKIRIYNGSSGMLLKHGEQYENPYNIVIESITPTAGTVSGFTPNTEVIPGTAVEFTYTPPTSSQAVRVEVVYHFEFKDGTQLGSSQTATAYSYVSSLLTNFNVETKSGNGGTGSAYTTAVWTKNYWVDNANKIPGIIDSLYMNVENVSIAGTTSHKSASYSGYNSEFIQYSGAGYSGQGSKSVATIKPAKLKDGADVTTIQSGSKIDLGVLSVYPKWAAYKATHNADFGDVYYANLGPLTQYYNSLQNSDMQKLYYADADAEWAEFLAAMDNASMYVRAPKITNNFATVYTQENLDAALERLQNACAALEEKRSSDATVDVLKDAMEAAEPAGTPGIDYQNYELYSYFQYADERTWNNNILASYEEPVAPDKYIVGSALSEAEINQIADAEGNATLKEAIKNTLVEPSAQEMADYEAAVLAYEAPNYTALQLSDAAAKIGYYKQFLVAKTTEKQFLAKEIAAANAQGYVEDNYSTDSWAAYQAALATANEVNSDPSALQSTVFDAKYELMIARNNLMAKADSAKDQGAYMQLESLIAQAEVMFQNTGLYTAKDGETAKAWANLVAALGYEYEDEDGATQNLYASSAKAFVAADRAMGTATQRQIDEQVAALQKAINQFTCSITVVPDEDAPGNDTNVEQGELVINGLVPATVNSEEDLLALVKASAPEGYTATLETVASAAGYYGTGATVKVNVAELGGQTVATYTVVIYGDVNGDGAVDAFDAAVLDLDLAGKAPLAGAYNLAADTNADADVAAADYALIKDVLAGTGTINQVR